MATDTPRPRTRAERQRETRDALVLAAREVFTRDGYHGANLGAIAREAGFSKGAVYSNFDSKAELFLAVMDLNLASIEDIKSWDPFQPLDTLGTPDDADPEHPGHREGDEAEREQAEALRGFALATLEFIASAARDPELSAQLAERTRLLLDFYAQVAEGVGADDEPLEVGDVAALLAALDQGVALLVLSGIASIDGALLRTGLRRLVDPARAVAEPLPVSTPGGVAIHDRDLQRAIFCEDEGG